MMDGSAQSKAAEAARFLIEREREMIDAVSELVEKNSFTENTDGGSAVGRDLDRIFALEGVTAKSVQSARFAEHRVYRTHGAVGLPPLALVGHLDTVFPPGLFEGIRKDGELLRGPGVLDMKGGLVVVAWALRAIEATVGLEAIAPIRLVVVSDEEVGSPEGQGVIRGEIADAKACLVFESGRKSDLIITRRKGTGVLTVTAHGRAAHAGNNHKDGANAIWALARFIDGAQKLTDYDRGLSVNVGRIKGGTSKNTVPDLAEAEVDLRFETKADADDLLAKLRALATDTGVEGTRLELSGGVARLPMERSQASERLYRAYAASARAVGLGDGEAPLIGGGSDASTSSAMGIASIDGLGPRGLGFHTKDEHIETKTLVIKAQALARFLLMWGTESRP